jgi:hypothetical protein
VIPDAALYLAGPTDAQAALLRAGGRPLAFRMVMAALRAGVRRVHVPAVFRGTAVARAIARTPSARESTVWLTAGAPPPGAVLLLPAAALVAPDAVRPLLAGKPPARLRASRATDAPLVVVPADTAKSLWPALAAGAAVADEVERALEGGRVTDLDTGWFARVTSAAGLRGVEARLYAALDSPADTRLDRAFHRRLSRPLTRLAAALGIPPNAVTVASLGVGLGAAWCFGQASPALALGGLALYAAAVVLDHADGEVARVTFAESALGAWLDVAVDTAIHVALALALGAAAQRAAGGQALLLGGVAAAGFLGSAILARTSPPATGPGAGGPPPRTGVGGLLDALSNRDGFYAMLGLFVAGLVAWPPALPALMLVVAAGSHAFWLGRLACTLAGRRA